MFVGKRSVARVGAILSAVVALSALGPTAATADIDATPPTLNEFSMSPKIADVSTEARTVIVTARISDDSSGVGVVQVFWAAT